MFHPAESANAHQWLDKYIQRVIDQRLSDLGIPRLFEFGVIHQVYKNGTKTFADIYLNGSSTLTTNVPVNPDITVAAGNNVMILKVNFHQADRYVLCKTLA